jgi:hypothetical protein
VITLNIALSLLLLSGMAVLVGAAGSIFSDRYEHRWTCVAMAGAGVIGVEALGFGVVFLMHIWGFV